MSEDALYQIESKKINYWKLACITVLILLLISCSIFVIWRSKLRPKCEDSKESISESEPVVTVDQKDEDSFSDKYKYLVQEFNLMRDSNSPAESQLFGFKFNLFHQDWECLNAGLNYNSDGVAIVCQQKQCSVANKAKFPHTVQVEKSEECSKELENREYAQSVLPLFKIDVSPIYLEEGKTLNEIENFSPNESTPNGLPYSFEVAESDNKRESGWSKQYKVVFYSPTEISDSLSKYTGTFYGSEKIYAKYQIVVDVYDVVEPEKALSKEKFLSLIEAMIDSIKFLGQPNNI